MLLPLGLATAVFGCDPPIDIAGPLTARIHPLSAASRTGMPVRIPVSLENRGSGERRGGDAAPVWFGALKTGGGCRLTRDGADVVRTPLPSSERFTLRLDWKALGWLRGESHEAEIDEDGEVLSRRPFAAMQAGNACWPANPAFSPTG